VKLLTQQYIESKLTGASYEYDPTVNRWVGWIDGVKGVCAQAKTVEKARDELGKILEEHLMLSLADKSISLNQLYKKAASPFSRHAKTNFSKRIYQTT